MKIPRKDFLKDSHDPKILNRLLDLTEKAFKTWQPIWSPFISAQSLAEIKRILEPLNEINCASYGGFQNAERQRVLFQRCLDPEEITENFVPIVGIKIKGNFLFDKTNAYDFLQDILKQGISNESIGDIWIIGEQGAELICTPEVGLSLNEQSSFIRTVEIKYITVKVNQLKLPIKRVPKEITTIEASIRIDAIASAGFGVSRSKIVNQIKEGKIRIELVKFIIRLIMDKIGYLLMKLIYQKVI